MCPHSPRLPSRTCSALSPGQGAFLSAAVLAHRAGLSLARAALPSLPLLSMAASSHSPYICRQGVRSRNDGGPPARGRGNRKLRATNSVFGNVPRRFLNQPPLRLVAPGTFLKGLGVRQPKREGRPPCSTTSSNPSLSNSPPDVTSDLSCLPLLQAENPRGEIVPPVVLTRAVH